MNKKQSAWRSPWVVAWVAILVVFVVISGVRIFLAIDTNPGLVVEDYYERGQDYEENRLKRQARDPGWRMEIEAPAFQFERVRSVNYLRSAIDQVAESPSDPKKKLEAFLERDF